MNIKTLLTIATTLIVGTLFAQRGKDGDYTVSGSAEIINTYTNLTVKAEAGATTLNVVDHKMNGAGFAGDLEPGDLLLIYQAQGIYADISTEAVEFWAPSTYTAQHSFFENGGPKHLQRSFIEFGKVTNYWSSGFYEFVEVKSVANNTISLMCGLKHTYFAGADDVSQVVRVPRYNSLTVPAGAGITAANWNGSVGGVVAAEVLNDLEMNGSGKITADGKGFRGGQPGTVGSEAAAPGSISDTNGRGHLGSFDPNEGSEKGESIFANIDGFYSRYGYGAVANGGGGGGYHNAGGGGGSNVGVGNYYGYGVVDRGPSNNYDAAWSLESPLLISQPSAGGGRGGYSHSNTNLDPLENGPHLSGWNGDYRRITGGVGGHPLEHSDERVFMGGGGGGGHGNDGNAGKGGNGGGAVFLTVYGSVIGNGTISANGQAGGNAEGNQPTGHFSSSVTGVDGAGGAGGGGAVKIFNANPLPSTLKIEAKGGKGGNQIIKKGNLYTGKQTQGPGGGGGGGMIAFASGNPMQNVDGGASGTTNSGAVLGTLMSNFPSNGATGGADGMGGQAAESLELLVDNDTVCYGSSATLNATLVGFSGGTTRWYTSYSGSSSVGTGTSLTLSNVTTDRTLYVGNCQVPYRVEVKIIVSPQIQVSGLPPTIVDETCEGNDGEITGITASGGIGNLTYSWNGNNSNNGDLTGATAGSYTLIISDETGCSVTEGPFDIDVTPDPVLDWSNVVIQPETCNGNDGKVIGVTVSGGSSPYTYYWDGNPSPSINLTNGVGGDHYLEVVDANGCSATAGPFNITPSPGPSINVANLAIQDESCLENNGSITGITASGGTGNLTYSWSSGETTLDINNLTAGSYTLTVTDDGGCTSIAGPYTIQFVPGPSIDEANVTIVDATCGDNNGAITGVVVNDGMAPLTYEWNGVSTTDEELTGAAPGTYSLVVTDAEGCAITSNDFVINDVQGPLIDVNNMVVTDESCGNSAGSIEGITISGGTAPLVYQWNGNTVNDLDLGNLSAGQYTLTVEDANGCTDEVGPIDVNGTPALTLDETNVTITDETCAGNDGAIVGIEVQGGEAPFTYSWNGENTVDENLANAVGGTYTLEVTDVNGCSAISSDFVIAASPGPAIDLSNVQITNESCAGNDGAITGISVSGGNPPYFYAWNNGTPSTNSDLQGVEAGNYTLIVADMDGCTATAGPFEVEAAAAIVADESNMVIQDETCMENDGAITGIIVSGGTGNLTFTWSDNAGNTVDINGMEAGTYTLTVTDDLDCELFLGPYTIEFIPGVSLDASNLELEDATCGENNGSITGIVANNGAAPIDYTWNGNASTGPDLLNAGPGSYTLTAIDANGCQTTVGPFEINDVPGPTIQSTNVVVVDETCAGNDGTISGIEINGGTAPFTYDWGQGNANSLDIENLAAGVYTLIVTDANGCVDQVTHAVAGPTLADVNIVTPDQEITLGANVTIEAEVEPADASIQWTPSEHVDCETCADITAEPETSTWYTITVTTDDGCQDSDSIYIKVNNPCHDPLFPTIFTPNGDGLNDSFCVIGGCLKAMELTIYNRWGEVIFRTNDSNECWDGTYKGEAVNTGTYTYQFNGTTIEGENIVQSGNVNLIR